MKHRANLWLLGLVSLLVWQTGCAPPVVENADRLNTFQLMTAAAAANGAGRVEEAGLLMFAGQARFQIDKQVYPPVKTGGNGPGVLKAALSSTLGGAIGKSLAANPGAFKNVAARLAKWSPKFDAGYDPGWEYANPVTGAAIVPIVSKTQKEMLSALEQKVKLLDNPEYHQLADQVGAAVVVEQKYWAAVEANHSANAVPEDLKKEFAEAQQKKVAAAKRMKEIEFATNAESRWHAQVGWKAEDYFEDKDVIALCHAIEDDNAPEMEKLIAAGADAKAVGKDGMTLLLWAFPDRRIARFECLLKHGADPNVVIQSDFNTKNRPFHPYPVGGSVFNDRGCHAGQCVTLLAARSPVIEYLQLVMEHGGNAKIVDGKTGEAPLDVVLDRYLHGDCEKRVQLLVAKGADVNRYCEYHKGYPTMEAVSNNLYDVALLLLKSGADPKLRQPDDISKLTNVVARLEYRARDIQPPPARTPAQAALIDWLEQHGESLEAAREEETAWREKLKGPPFGPEGVPVKMKEFVREREEKAANR